MKLFLIALSSFLLLFNSQAASQSFPQVILEVKANGFKLEPEGEHTYLRVYDDGQVGYEDYSDLLRAFRLQEYRLSSEQLKSLTEELKSAEVQKIRDHYALASPLSDVANEIKITIPHAVEVQAIEINRRDASSEKRPDYPDALIGLICHIEKLRSNAVIRLIDMKRCQPHAG